MGKFGHLVNGAAWAISGKAVQLVLNLVTFVLVARLAGPEAHGVYALGWLALGLFDIVVARALTETLIQRKRASIGHFNVTFWATLLIALLGWVIVWRGATMISSWLNGGVLLAAILPIRASVFVLRAIGVGPSAQLMRESRFRAVAKAEMLASIASNLIGVNLALAGAGIWSLVYLEVSRALIVTLAAYWLTHWRSDTTRWRSAFANSSVTRW